MFVNEGCNVVDLAVDYHPKIISGGVLLDFSELDDFRRVSGGGSSIDFRGHCEF